MKDTHVIAMEVDTSITTQAIAKRHSDGGLTVHTWWNNTNEGPVLAMLLPSPKCQYDKAFQKLVNEKAGTTTAVIDEWLGREYIALALKEGEKTFEVLEATLRFGANIRITSFVSIYMTPEDLADNEHVTPEKIEDVFVTMCEKRLQQQLTDNTASYFHSSDWETSTFSYVNARSTKAWFTQRAKDFLRLLKQLRLVHIEDNEVTEQPSAAPIETKVLQPEITEIDEKTMEPPPAKRQKTEEEDDIIKCMVCLEALPDTIVYPCKHACVCSACSPQLRTTRDAKTCLRCRKRIESIDEPDGILLL